MKLMQTCRIEVRANWKVALDAQNALYHFPFQHRQILGAVFAVKDKGQSRYRNVELYKHHRAWSSEYHPAFDLTPLKIALYAAPDLPCGGAMTRIAGSPAVRAKPGQSQWPPRRLAATLPTGWQTVSCAVRSRRP